jgi:hypothetical protein
MQRFTRADIYSSVEFNEPLQSNAVGEFVKAADHEAERERLVGLLREYVAQHRDSIWGACGCDLCKRTDAALAKENQ